MEKNIFNEGFYDVKKAPELLTTERHPIGIVPKYIWEMQRMDELAAAINRYTEARLEVSIEWIQEYNELALKYKKH